MAGQLAVAELPSPSAAEWRAAMGYFPTGVTVVTSWRGEAPLGSTINAFCSVSLEPPLLLICLDKSNPLYGPVQASGVFGVNMLGAEDGTALARHFATGPDEGRFEAHDWRWVGSGAPQLESAPVFIDCAVQAVYDSGDHVIVVGQGLRTVHSAGELPLLYHGGNFPKFPSTP